MKRATEPPDVACVSFDSHTLHALSDRHGVMRCGALPDWLMVGPTWAVAKRADQWCPDCYPDHPSLSPKEWATMSHTTPRKTAEPHGRDPACP